MIKELEPTITVAELIDALEELPKDATVELGGDIKRHGHLGVMIGDVYYGVANTMDGIIYKTTDWN